MGALSQVPGARCSPFPPPPAPSPVLNLWCLIQLARPGIQPKMLSELPRNCIFGSFSWDTWHSSETLMTYRAPPSPARARPGLHGLSLLPGGPSDPLLAWAHPQDPAPPLPTPSLRVRAKSTRPGPWGWSGSIRWGVGGGGGQMDGRQTEVQADGRMEKGQKGGGKGGRAP